MCACLCSPFAHVTTVGDINRHLCEARLLRWIVVTNSAHCEHRTKLRSTQSRRLSFLPFSFMYPAPFMFQVEDDYLAKLQDCFGVVRSVNKSDVLTLASNFGSLKAVCDASAEELAVCPGLGEKKIARIHEALHEPLSRTHRLKRNRLGL